MKTDFKTLKRTLAVLVVFLFLVISFNYLPEHEFAFSPTPQNGHSGGINGVYVREDFESCGEYSYSYGIFQFYNDGTVLYVPTCSDGDIINDWTDIKKWFRRNNDVEIPRGKYFVSQNQIWFSTSVYYEYNGENVTTDYSGTYSENKLILDVYSHYNGHKKSGVEYLKIDVEQ
ncbi:MAG: hypothetical protein Q8L64_00370 [bacterium]|nr:hypothetical protein [bacterium]